MRIQAQWYSDPGHEWLKVPLSIVRAVGMVPTEYSYKKGAFAYLEGDCDAPAFKFLLEKTGLYLELDPDENSAEQDSPIRGFQRFSKPSNPTYNIYRSTVNESSRIGP